MGVVVTVPHQAEPWKVGGGAFRLLVAEVEILTSDSEFMVRAEALNGLHLGMETIPERQRQAVLLAEATRELRSKLLARRSPTEWEMSLADYLPVLEMWMDGLAEGPDRRTLMGRTAATSGRYAASTSNVNAVGSSRTPLAFSSSHRRAALRAGSGVRSG